MDRLAHFRIRIHNNEWIHTKLVQHFTKLSATSQLISDSRIIAIKHLLEDQLYADYFWIRHFARYISKPIIHPQFEAIGFPKKTGTIESLEEYIVIRQSLDYTIRVLCEQMTQQDLDKLVQVECYNDLCRPKSLFHFLMHFFNHQAYLRQLVLKHLKKEGIDLGVDELIVPNAQNLIPAA